MENFIDGISFSTQNAVAELPQLHHLGLFMAIKRKANHTRRGLEERHSPYYSHQLRIHLHSYNFRKVYSRPQ